MSETTKCPRCGADCLSKRNSPVWECGSDHMGHKFYEGDACLRRQLSAVQGELDGFKSHHQATHDALETMSKQLSARTQERDEAREWVRRLVKAIDKEHGLATGTDEHDTARNILYDVEYEARAAMGVKNG